MSQIWEGEAQMKKYDREIIVFACASECTLIFLMPTQSVLPVNKGKKMKVKSRRKTKAPRKRRTTEIPSKGTNFVVTHFFSVPRTKRLADITAADVPPGIDPDNLAIDLV
jgi:hypothetical protein